VFSRESVAPPADGAACDSDGSLNCHGYGSSVMVTAAMGMTAAAEAVACAWRAAETTDQVPTVLKGLGRPSTPCHNH
jgi:tRNA A37 threonylcarbamoyladenosine dehydratase